MADGCDAFMSMMTEPERLGGMYINLYIKEKKKFFCKILNKRLHFIKRYDIVKSEPMFEYERMDELWLI